MKEILFKYYINDNKLSHNNVDDIVNNNNTDHNKCDTNIDTKTNVDYKIENYKMLNLSKDEVNTLNIKYFCN